MKEFNIYDNKMVHYYQNHIEHILPLNSWEFYGEYFQNMINFKEDIDALQKLSAKWDFNKDFIKEMVVDHKVVIVTKPTLEIVYASHNILRMNGYAPNEVVGKLPKMFQGEQTCKETTGKVRKAIQDQEPFEVSILNYRKDRSIYQCNIQGFPILNTKGKLVNYIAFEQVA